MRIRRALVVFACLCFCGGVSSTPAEGQAPSETAGGTGAATLSEEAEILVGRWVRTDAYYLIEVRPSEKGDAFEVGYFNPKPINVGSAEFTESVAGPVLTVVLQDVNYPGSTYILTYDRAKDALIGSYFQAVQGLTFDVAFIRQK